MYTDISPLLYKGEKPGCHHQQRKTEDWQQHAGYLGKHINLTKLYSFSSIYYIMTAIVYIQNMQNPLIVVSNLKQW